MNDNLTAEKYFNKIRGDNTYLMVETLPDRQRLVVQAKLYAPAFRQGIGMALEKYNMLPTLRDPKATFRVLDLGCGEGLYAPILTQFLKEQGCKAKVQIVGIDRDGAAVATAHEYTKALGLNAQFFVHDVTNPLKSIQFLNLNDPSQHFDLIICSVVLMHLANVLDLLPQIYAILKPAGAFFTKNMSWLTSVYYPDSSFARLNNLVFKELVQLLGIDFAARQEEYLKEAGFENLESFEDSYPIGGQTEPGRRMLENILLSQHASRPMIVKMGIMTAEEYDNILKTEFTEFSPNIEGHLTLVNTIGQRVS